MNCRRFSLARSLCDRQTMSCSDVGTSSAIGSKHLTPGTLRSYFRPPPNVIEGWCARGSSARESGDPLLIRRQTRLSRGVKDMLVTGITVTTLLTSAATASAQNFFEALFGRPGFSPGLDANFTARDRRELANPPWPSSYQSTASG